MGDAAAVTALVDDEAAETLGSLGLFLANGPVAAHLPGRMHRSPPRVVLALAGIAPNYKHRAMGLVPDGLGMPPASGLAILPR